MATDRKLLAALIAGQETIQKGIEVATALLIASGRSAEAAGKEIEGCQKEVEKTKLVALYKTFKETITTNATAFAKAFAEAGHVPETVDQFEVVVAYTPVELKIKDDQIVQPGGYVSRVRIKEADGDDTWKTISAIGRQTRGGGNGGSRNVLCPKDAPFKSWKVHAAAGYRVVEEKPNYDAGELKLGTGYSAPDQLSKVGDAVYIYCATLKKTEDRQATWQEVLEECPGAAEVDYGDE